ncbi:BMP and activin membrane-bound inhibitor homolog [Geospiza fortis]|uniref:BMP and activin membrane-bound inhibitor homolog n=1 Tax=Geospiza fortis TaxID=48883 RepID=A0A8N5ESN1_GEOFO|nr:BMP and activin membrane-bound inhibitor homolog [Geospiza fortis]
MLHTVLQLAICANLSLVPASPDCLILRIHIPHLLMAAWTLLQAQLRSAKPNKHKTTLAPPPCPHWNAVMKICAITEDYMMFCLLPGAMLQDKGVDTNTVQELTSSKELWFRAAVIAVPIAGGLILVLLIMLALRMLRSENKRLQDQRQQMLSRLHYSFHGHHSKKGQVAKLDLECMVPVTGHENCCMTCDKMRHSDLSNDKILSLVHWGMYSGHGKLEFV